MVSEQSKDKYAYPMRAYNYPRFGSPYGSTTITQDRLTDEPGTVEIGISLVRMREYIYKVSGLLVHPAIELASVEGHDMMGPGHPGPVVFRVRYRDRPLDELPVMVEDEYGRKFDTGPRFETPKDRSLLHITFETEDHRAMSAVFYFNPGEGSKDFPELEIDPHVPMEYRQGFMPSSFRPSS